jgi:LmbE family N-acetylglucosaminyl deacetylase
MTHVFVGPHPDDVALSCGGLIASLRELGQNVAILTVYSGEGGLNGDLTPFQREALGFGSKTLWPVTEAFNRSALAADVPEVDDPRYLPPFAATTEALDATQEDADAAAKRFWQRSSWYRRASVRNRPLAGQAVIDALPTQGAILTDDITEAAAAGDLMARRRLEEERYALFAEISVVFLDLPDAVFRGYRGDDELLGPPRPDDAPPLETLRREIDRLEPQKVYLPLGIGGHVDHRLCRDVGLQLLAIGRRWIMPGPEYAGSVTFYEDFPYAWWSDFNDLEDLPDVALDALPADVGLEADYADIDDQIERKITGIALYDSQVERLFGSTKEMASAVRAYARKVALQGALPSVAERYWSTRAI